jgi:hypothetical protein
VICGFGPPHLGASMRKIRLKILLNIFFDDKEYRNERKRNSVTNTDNSYSEKILVFTIFFLVKKIVNFIQFYSFEQVILGFENERINSNNVIRTHN